MGVVETAPANSSEMCQASNDLWKAESDDDFKWEEFFGTSVDITSTLLDMFDAIVAKNVDAKAPPAERSPKRHQHHRPARLYSKRSYPDSHPSCDKRRPLSSSSSSSSCSSLPRSLSSEVKRSAYLASIESLEDNEDQEGGGWVDHPDLSHMDRVILEIVDTEKTYVRDLGQIIGGYLNHMKSAQDMKISSKCLEELFSNVEDIYQFNSLFVKELEACGLDPVTVARCFVKSSCGFEVYTQYCTNYPRTVSVLTELMGSTQTAEIFKERQVSLQHSLPLGSYLLKPVQRILKYHLLLQNMVKHYCGGEEGCWDVKNALSVMTGIACHINDMKRKHEHAVRVQEIQSLLYGWEGQDLTTYGELVGEGAFRMYRAKALRHLFLFDRMLLIAKKREEGTLSYKTHIVCSNLMLIESIQGEPLCFHVIPFDNPRHQYTFQARNVEQKREWCLQLKRVILENYNAVIPSHARQLVMELGQSKTDDSAVERSLTKRPLSAPEYLEKRKQERRKSEINLKKSIVKKDDHKQRWPLGRLGNNNKENNCGASSSSSSSFSRGARARHSLPEPSLHHKDRRFRNQHQSWRAWNGSVPEETTDTENEDLDGKKPTDYRRLPPHSIYRDRAYSEVSEEGFDNGGEYVTFFHAHAYATRDLNRAYLDIGQEGAHSDVENNAHGQERKDSDGCHSRHEQSKDQDSESGSSWKQNPAIRRVQSFTGMAKAKVQSLQHNLSFKYSSSSQSGKTKTLSLPPIGSSSILPNKKTSSLPPIGSSSILPETSPATWLKQQEEHLADVERKSGSLPRSFQLSSTNESNSPKTLENSRESLTKVSGLTCGGRTRMRLDGTRCVHNERPFTIASDTPSQADFGDDLDYVLLDYSRYTGTEYYFHPQINRYEQDTTTGCTNTPAVSMENVHSIHPELKIYHQSASKYATLKHLFYHMGSKIAGFRASLASPSPQDTISSSELITKTRCQSDTHKNGFKRSGSHSSIKSGENERNPRILTAKLAHSVAKAYSSVMRHRKKHEIKITNVGRKNEKTSLLGTYKSESSLIGARMAQPLESEYSVPKYILSPQFLKDLRPDSLFSESSSDGGDKAAGNKSGSRLHNSGSGADDDSVSEASDTSADSYYERTFDEIENALAQDVFRDSAIYSDPEDADFGNALEKPGLSFCSKESFEIPKIDKTAFLNLQNGDADAAAMTSPKIMCARKVNRAILERLRVLEENVKIQNEEAASVVNRTTVPLKKLDLDKYGNLVSNREAVEESETSSEHSASTVIHTVMESGQKEHLTAQGSKALPRMKGWVKHVVDKLQGEGPV